jgi:hypothetical protein
VRVPAKESGAISTRTGTVSPSPARGIAAGHPPADKQVGPHHRGQGGRGTWIAPSCPECASCGGWASRRSSRS